MNTESPYQQSEDEKVDLAVLTEKTNEIKLDMFDYMRALLGMDEAGLKASGHKSLGAALEYTIRDRDKQVNKLVQAHITKWPD